MTDDPRLSVIVSARCHPASLANTITSFTKDPFESLEIIVLVEDECPAESAVVARTCARLDSRVRLASGEAVTAFDAALKLARGAYFAFVDGGHSAVPGAYERLIAALDRTCSDLAVGVIVRLDSHGLPEPAHTLDALTPTESATVSSHPELLEVSPSLAMIIRRSSAMTPPSSVRRGAASMDGTTLLLARTIDIHRNAVLFAEDRGTTEEPASEESLADRVDDLHNRLRDVQGAPSVVRRAIADQILKQEILALGRLDAIGSAGAETVLAASLLVRECAAELNPSALAALPIHERWELALVALAAPHHITHLHARGNARQALSALDAAADSLPRSLALTLGLGEESVAEAFQHRYAAPIRRTSAGREVIAEYDGPPEVSVIVPTHDVGPYIDELLASIRAAVDVRLEIIVVDDSSRDDTWNRIRAHAAVDRRVRTFRSPGTGGGPARNHGIAQAQGEYLAFADGDDIVPRVAYAAMLESARASGADVVSGDYVKFFLYDTWDARTGYRYAYATNLYGVDLRTHPQLAMHRTCWNRLISREFWLSHSFTFPDVPRANDIVPILGALVAAENLTVIPDVTYIYRNRPGDGSMTSAAGTVSYTASYLSQEVACADLIAGVEDETLSREYWSMVLGTDGWGALDAYLAVPRDATEAVDDGISSAIARLLDAAPPAQISALTASQQAIWCLAAEGDYDSARILLHAESEPLARVVDAVEAAIKTGRVGSRATAWLVMRDVVPRVAGRPHAEMAILVERIAELARRVEDWASFEAAAGVGGDARRLVAAWREGRVGDLDAGPRVASAEAAAMYRPLLRGVIMRGVLGAFVQNGDRIIATGVLDGRPVRLPVARVRAVGSADMWRAEIHPDRFPSLGRWALTVDGADERSAHRARIQVTDGTPPGTLSRLKRVAWAPHADGGAAVVVRAPLSARIHRTLRRAARRLSSRAPSVGVAAVSGSDT